MMSSEEESTESFGLFGDKLCSILLKKQQQLLQHQQQLQQYKQRNRQRVDAGEPRNSYSSIPTFSSRPPAFMSGGLYGAIFSQQNQQHFGSLFGPGGYGPAKMLNELLGRQVKQEQFNVLGQQAQNSTAIANESNSTSSSNNPSPSCNNSANNNQLLSNSVDQPQQQCVNTSISPSNQVNNSNSSANLVAKAAADVASVMETAMNCEDSAVAQAASDLTHHMLRNILQGKKELLALDQELLRKAASEASSDLPDNNNILNKNNNITNNNNYDAKSENVLKNGASESSEKKSDEKVPEKGDEGGKEVVTKVEPTDEDALQASDSRSESPISNGGDNKDDVMDVDSDKEPSPTPSKPEIDLKRARVENIVSSMRASPQQVNGCKKRKLYHPQQHDNSSVIERYAAAAVGLNLGLNFHNFMMNNAGVGAPTEVEDEEEDEAEPQQIHQKRVEKNILKSQLKSMQEQLAEMQQKYLQLCSRMEQSSDLGSGDENSSDIVEDDLNNEVLNKRQAASPVLAKTPPLKEIPAPKPVPTPTTPNTMLSQLSKMMSAAKIMPPHLAPPQHPFLHHLQAQQAAMQEQMQVQQAQAPHLSMYQKFLEQQEAAARRKESQEQDLMGHQVAPQSQQGPPQQREQPQTQQAKGNPELTERLTSLMRPVVAPQGPVNDLEGLAELLKSEISASLSTLVDTILTRFLTQRKFLGKASEQAAAASEQFSKDLLNAAQLLDRKSPRNTGSVGAVGKDGRPPNSAPAPAGAAMFQTPKPPTNMQISSVAAAALYNSMNALSAQNNPMNPFCMPQQESREVSNEQAEALSLVVTPKKKRHKVTDTRITPRTVSRILAQDGIVPQNVSAGGNGAPGQEKQFPSQPSQAVPSVPSESPSPRQSYHPPVSSAMLPVSLPTSVAIPNPSLHESQVFSPYSPFFNPHGPPHGPQHGAQLHHMHMSASPPGLGNMMDPRDSPPLPHPPTMIHPALLAAHHGNSPDFSHIRAAMDANDRNSDCNSGDISYDGIPPTSATLTPMHLRKAKLMFFWVRYPSSAVLKMYFPDIKFGKNNTAQLVKWFSNFREFYYIQMEKYARQAVSEGLKSVDDIHITCESEIYRVLNLHYNRNNHIEVPQNFRFVVEQTLREFFKAIQSGKDQEQSWKKSIYKIISRLDDPVPEYFKSPNFLEQLE